MPLFFPNYSPSTFPQLFPCYLSLLLFPATFPYYFPILLFPTTFPCHSNQCTPFSYQPPLSKKAAVLVRPTCFMYADKLIPKDYTKGGAM